MPRISIRCLPFSTVAKKKTQKYLAGVEVTNWYNIYIIIIYIIIIGTAEEQRLRCCATNRKVAGSIPDGVIGIFL
jgi:hypothetical protein